MEVAGGRGRGGGRDGGPALAVSEELGLECEVARRQRLERGKVARAAPGVMVRCLVSSGGAWRTVAVASLQRARWKGRALVKAFPNFGWCRQRRRLRASLTLLKALSWSSSRTWGLRVKTQAPSGAGDGDSYVVSFLEALLWRASLLSLFGVPIAYEIEDVGAAAPGWRMCAEAAASGSGAVVAP